MTGGGWKQRGTPVASSWPQTQFQKPQNQLNAYIANQLKQLRIRMCPEKFRVELKTEIVTYIGGITGGGGLE